MLRVREMAEPTKGKDKIKDVSDLLICCFKKSNTLVVVDKFYGIMNVTKLFQDVKKEDLNASIIETIETINSTDDAINCQSAGNSDNNKGGPCIIFVQKNSTKSSEFDSDIKPFKDWTEVDQAVNAVTLKVLKNNAKKDIFIHAFSGNCSAGASSCSLNSLNIGNYCRSATFKEDSCRDTSFNDRYKINMTQKECVNCDNPVKKPEQTLIVNVSLPEGTTFTPSEATKTKPNISTKLFIHLVTALLLLNFTFLINDLVANMNSPSGCEAIAFLMHYFMLVTFTWFGMHAFHLCLQMYVGSSITIKRYVLKVSVSSWTIPSIFVIAFLIAKKYGELRIYTNDSEKISKMCWIIDNKAHMIVNVGYYIVVFILTFSTVIISMYWLCRFKQSKTDNLDKNETSKRILFTLGLCSQLGVTWGFAFFAYGAFRIPAYYIFTVLNSLQGFFLFIYYYNSGHVGNEKLQDKNKKTTSNSTNVSTLKSSSESDNPYYSNQMFKNRPN